MIEASAAIQVLPKVPDESVIPIVDEVIAYIKSTGLNMSVGPFETTIEGGFDEIMEVVKNCQLKCAEAGAPGVMTYVKIHYNPGGGVWSIDEKVSKHNR